MGYFAITLEHDEKEKEKFIEGLRRNPVLELRGMGGIGRNKRGESWFFTGFGLETFVRHYLVRKSAIDFSVCPGFCASDEQSSYYEGLQRSLQAGSVSAESLSPFEKPVPEQNATALYSRLMGDRDTSAALNWCGDQIACVLRAYGTIPLKVRGEADVVPNAFRFRESTGTGFCFIPFLTVAISVNNPVGRLLTTVQSESTIWLRDGFPLGGVVERSDADANLDMLRVLCEYLSRISAVPASGSIWLEGSAFRRDKDRFVDALRNIPCLEFAN
jgi:hypothetical protein